MLGSRHLLWAVLLFPSAAIYADTIIPPGPVSGTWTETGSPYLIQGEITISSDSTLIIEPGVDVIFQGHYKFIVHGYLEALGTASDSILFTATNPDTGWHGIRFIDASDSSQLRFCSVEYGKASGPWNHPDSYGGGIFCTNSNPVFLHCVFQYNQAQQKGGAIYCQQSNPMISYCTIGWNDAVSLGGGLFLETSNATILNCAIRQNYAAYSGNGAGGGIYCEDANPVIQNCDISGNATGSDFGISGGGIFLYNSHPSIHNCSIFGNSVGFGYGGGIYCNGSNPTIDSTVIQDNIAWTAGAGISTIGSNPIITHCTIANNIGCFYGSGINVLASNPTISNCTISGNESNTSGSIYFHNSMASITNTIISGNLGAGSVHFEDSSDISITYCDITDNNGGNFTGNVPDSLGLISITNLNGDSCDIFFNIRMDPLFIAPELGDYHLQSPSPCIDAGDPNSQHDPDSTVADIGAFYFHQTGIHENRAGHSIPTSFRLYQNYPNPFNSSTSISFALPVPSKAALKIYDITGRHVAILFNGFHEAGTHNVIFDASGLSSGVYFCQLKTYNNSAVTKMVLLK